MRCEALWYTLRDRVAEGMGKLGVKEQWTVVWANEFTEVILKARDGTETLEAACRHIVELLNVSRDLCASVGNNE